jgi:hypothetical protein
MYSALQQSETIMQEAIIFLNYQEDRSANVQRTRRKKNNHYCLLGPLRTLSYK